MENDSPISASARAKIRIRIKGVDYRMADQTAADIIASIAGTGARISGPFPLPSQVEEPRTALREEIRSHRRLIEIIGSSPKTVDAFRRHNIPAGIEIHHDGDLPARSGLGSSSSFTAAKRAGSRVPSSGPKM